MTSKQRVLETIALRRPDRIPVDFNANPGTLARLMNDLQVATHRELLDRLHVDIVDLRGVVDPIYRGPVPKEQDLGDGVTENWLGWRTRRMETATGPEDAACEFILAEAKSVEEMTEWRWFDVDWFDFSDFAERLQPWIDLAVMASGASVFQHPTFLRGCDNLLADMALRPDMAEYVIDRHTDFYVAFFDRMFQAAPGKVDILRIADDLGMQDRLMISPAMFDQFIGPRLDRIVRMAHDHSVKIMFHTCGAVVPLIDRLIDLGVDMLDPIQVRAKDMDPAQIKERFGSRIALHGAIDTQYLLPRGTPEEVADDVRKMIDTLGPEGYVISPCHVLQTDVPTANVLALYDTANEVGGG